MADLHERFGDGEGIVVEPPTLDSVLAWLGVRAAGPAVQAEAAARYRSRLAESEVSVLVRAGLLRA